jgi:hypothetical protein
VWVVELGEYVAWHLKKETERAMKVIYKLILNHTNTVLTTCKLQMFIVSTFSLIHNSYLLFPKSRDLVAFRFPSKNLSSVIPLVPMLILLPLFRSTVSKESDGTGLSLTWGIEGQWH